MAFWIAQWLKSYGENFGVVKPGLLFRSSQQDSDRLIKYRDKYGVRAVLNLREGLSTKEGTEARAAGLLWYNIPMSDGLAPTVKQITEGLQIIEDCITSSLPLVVCCKGGRHRTGVMIAVYRVVVDGWSKEDAWKEAKKYGFYAEQGHEAIETWFWQFDPAQFKTQPLP